MACDVDCAHQAPLCVEYCSGNGHWVVAAAHQQPTYHWIAVEQQLGRAHKIIAKKNHMHLSNLEVVCAEAKAWTAHALPAQSVTRAYIHFPDPWPKRRHHKHRLMHASFLTELARVLIAHGEVTLVSDDRTYVEAAIALFAQQNTWIADLPAPHLSALENYGNSTFAQRWQRLGRAIYLTRWRRL